MVAKSSGETSFLAGFISVFWRQRRVIVVEIILDPIPGCEEIPVELVIFLAMV